MDRQEAEKKRVREWNRELLLEILEVDSLIDEKQNPMMNLKSQMLLRAALHTINVLYKVAYKDPEPKGNANAIYRDSMRRNLYQRFTESCEMEYNFIAARKIFIRAIRELDMEQAYDLHFLLRFNLGSVRDDDCYTVTQSLTLDFPYSAKSTEKGANSHEAN